MTSKNASLNEAPKLYKLHVIATFTAFLASVWVGSDDRVSGGAGGLGFSGWEPKNPVNAAINALTAVTTAVIPTTTAAIPFSQVGIDCHHVRVFWDLAIAVWSVLLFLLTGKNGAGVSHNAGYATLMIRLQPTWPVYETEIYE